MSIYAIGDLQGCYQELIDLLNEINFDSSNDRLWFVGDLVNRGPESLKTLRFVKSLGHTAKTVLGNHDLHLLAVANKVRKAHREDTLTEIIEADDANDLFDWIRQQALLVNDTDSGFTMVHAGLAPQWSLDKAKELAKETEALIKSDRFNDFIHNMYGNQPHTWSDQLTGDARYRCIINCFTRIRYIDKHNKLNMKKKDAPGTQKTSLTPWYAIPKRKTNKDKIIFGHWSTVHLGNEKDFKQYLVYPLDTGCLWGRELTALRLEDEKMFHVPSRQPEVEHEF